MSADLTAGREARMPRAEIAATMRQAGIPDAIAHEATDLACQATNKALDTIIDTCDLATTPGARMNALSIAVALAKNELKVLEEAMELATKTVGLRTIFANVGGAHG